MVQPFVLLLVDIEHRAEGAFVEFLLCALIDDGAFIARERRAVLFAFEEVLPHFGPDGFEEEPQMCRDGVVAQDRVAGLRDIAQAKGHQHGKADKGAGEEEGPGWPDNRRPQRGERKKHRQGQRQKAELQ